MTFASISRHCSMSNAQSLCSSMSDLSSAAVRMIQPMPSGTKPFAMERSLLRSFSEGIFLETPTNCSNGRSTMYLPGSPIFVVTLTPLEE